MKAIPLLFLAILFTVANPVFAASNDMPKVPTRFEHYLLEYRLNDDGSHEEIHEWAMAVLKEQAVARAKQVAVTYSAGLQKAEVTEAYTRKADGRRIDVPKNNFQVKTNTGRGKNAPVFSDMATISIVFPDLAVGDSVVFAYKITQTEPVFPGKFSMSGNFPKVYAYDDVVVRFDFPASLWAQYEGREMAEKVTEKSGRKIVEWTYQNKRPLKNVRKDYSVYDIEKEPGFAFSTFRSYEEIAEAYGARARPKAAVTDRTRKLADEITAGRTDPREQARALYDWVAANITFAGNCLSEGTVVPHDIDFILDNRIGDCKDHATLFQALLASKGMESTQALLNAKSAYRLPRIPVVSSINHVINYIPGFDLYADSTAETIPFGMLPLNVTGKPVLLVDGFKDGSHTPIQAPGENRQEMTTAVKIRPDGSVAGKIDIVQKGMFAVNTREWIRKLPREDEEEIVKATFQRQGRMGSGTLERGDATELRDTFQYAVQFELKDFLQLPGTGAFKIEPFLPSAAPVSQFTRAAVEQIEDVDVTCSNGYSSEEYVYEFPKGMKIVSVPENLNLATETLSYSATYKLKGNKLTVKRIFDDKTPGKICSPEVTRAYQEFAKKILPNARAQVVYK